MSTCQRHQCRRPRMLHVNVPEERGSTAHDAWWTNFRSSGTILGQNWLCAVLNWSTNTAIGDSGHSPSQWVLGRSLRLPFQLLSRASQLASHQRHRDDFAYQRRVAMLAETQRSIISTRYNKALRSAFLSRARSANHAPSQVLQSEIRSCSGVGTTSERVSGRCVGWVQGLSLGTKVVQSCGSVIVVPLSRQLQTTFDSRRWKSNSPVARSLRFPS